MKTMTKAGAIVLFFSVCAFTLSAQSTDTGTPISTTSTTIYTNGLAQTQSQELKNSPTPLPEGSGQVESFEADIESLESTLVEIAKTRRSGWPEQANPWENNADFMRRLSSTEADAVARLEKKTYSLGSPKVRLTANAFDKDSKSWQISVESTDPNFPFMSKFRYSIISAPDIGATYTAFDSLVKTGALEGVAYFTIKRKSTGVYAIEIMRVAISDKTTGQMLARDDSAKAPIMFYSREPGVRLSDGLNSLKTAKDMWQMVRVEGDTFQMGSLVGDVDQKPVHQVTLGSFLIGKYEVTVGEFRSFVEATRYRTQAEETGGGYVWNGRAWKKDGNTTWLNPGFVQTERDPVTVVSWNDAAEYCNWLSWKEGIQPAYRKSGDNYYLDWTRDGYRLPTEAQWEFAARGGRGMRGSAFAGSVDIRLVAWFYNNSDNRTHPIGTKDPNELGLFDCAGNVWEWCLDWYDNYPSGAQTDPRGPESGTHRVLRGGSFASDESACKPTYRGAFNPSLALNYLGFRVARPIM